ncbi:MAG TPA: hypothetical protein VKG62_03080 [Solirubrobacteraceae bacterium]|nr:hypothetical protein [Solirubrobacteraceae bacterium]
MFSSLRKPPLAVFCMLAALAPTLGACGESHTRVTTGTYAGESGANAPYLNVGPLIYQVQLSRELNPAAVEDSSYLEGLTPAQRRLNPGQEWFGVFVQVYNQNSVPLPASTAITISDTQGNVYTPTVPDTTNLYAFRGGLVEANGQLPVVGSTAWSGPTQGALLLYKIQVVSLDNRPLEVKIINPARPTEAASAELDV